jgi:hypothetical protein
VAAPFFATAPSPCATAESHHLGSALGPGVADSRPDGCVIVSGILRVGGIAALIAEADRYVLATYYQENLKFVRPGQLL